jgi:hypothetical protein
MESDENIRPSKNGTTNDSDVDFDMVSRQENAGIVFTYYILLIRCIVLIFYYNRYIKYITP